MVRIPEKIRLIHRQLLGERTNFFPFAGSHAPQIQGEEAAPRRFHPSPRNVAEELQSGIIKVQPETLGHH